jgi:hypothetical protein
MQFCGQRRQKSVRHTVVFVRGPEFHLRPHEIWLGGNWAAKFMNKAG